MVFKLHSAKLSDYGYPKRSVIREPDRMQPEFSDCYDFDTLFYDVFFVEKNLIFISPRLDRVVVDSFSSGLIINGRKLSEYNYSLVESGLVVKIIVELNDVKLILLNGRELIFDLWEVPSEFKNIRLLYTLQKDNRSEWISDWMKWYIEAFDVSRVLIFDNNSKVDYSEFLLDSQLVDFIDVDFPYGPGAYNGSSWDSAYLQFACFEIVRYRLRGVNTTVFNFDIDELLSTKDSDFLNDVLSKKSIIFFPGKWVCPSSTSISKIYYHRDHDIIDNQEICPNKWIVNIDKIPDHVFLQVHNVKGLLYHWLRLESYYYFHCRSITTNWKYVRKAYLELSSPRFISFDEIKDFFK